MWKESYIDVRAKIEASGRDARWEFDRKRLFERTDYMAKICENIHEIAQVLQVCSMPVKCFSSYKLLFIFLKKVNAKQSKPVLIRNAIILSHCIFFGNFEVKFEVKQEIDRKRF